VFVTLLLANDIDLTRGFAISTPRGFFSSATRDLYGRLYGCLLQSSIITHRDDGGTRCSGKVLDDLPIGLFDRRGVRRSWRVGCVRLRGRRDGLGTWCVEQQLDPGLAAIAAAAHVLPQAGPPSGASHTSYHPRPDLALEEGSLLYYPAGNGLPAADRQPCVFLWEMSGFRRDFCERNL